MDRNAFTPIGKVWLSLSRLLGKSLLLDNINKGLEYTFYKNSAKYLVADTMLQTEGKVIRKAHLVST